jgi:hypothetical protein
VESAPGTEYYWGPIEVRLSRLMDNPLTPHDPMRVLVDLGHLNRVPEAVTSGLGFEHLEEEGRPILQVHAPGEIIIRRPADANRLAGTFGLRAGSHGPSRNGDGVTFSAELRRDDGSTALLWQRHLDPQHLPADRGPQDFALDLPPGDYRLILRTGIGPAGNGDWDWSYWAGITLTP